ncbi:Uncharacterised protein [Burkholderia pseudomallei]|nr:Uncharacterised protein [Burkholderia pseudomallei]
MNSGPITTTDVQYSVRLDLATGNTSVARIDEDAAKQVALTALASTFINMKPTALSSDDITFTSTVSGKKCVVEVTTQTSDEPKRWLVKKLDCKH